MTHEFNASDSATTSAPEKIMNNESSNIRCTSSAGRDRDFSSLFESPLTILEDLITIQEIGNSSGRAISILLSAIRYVDDLKAINGQLLQAETADES